MGEWIVDVKGIQKIYGLKHHIVEIRGGVTRRDEQRTTTNKRTMEDKATQPLGCWKAEFRNFCNCAFSVVFLLKGSEEDVTAGPEEASGLQLV